MADIKLFNINGKVTELQSGIRYKKFRNDLLMFEHINENVATAIPDTDTPVSKTKNADKTFDEQLKNADESIKTLYHRC